MVSEVIDNHITKCYNRWLDYARYHASLASIPDQAEDILNGVLVSILSKEESFLNELLSKKTSCYTELDFYVLRAIKLNCHSPTSPHRHKTRDVPRDRNINPWDLDVVDRMEDHQDHELIRLEKSSREGDVVRSVLLNECIPGT